MQRDLTPCQQQLFELLGVDSRVVLWAAAAAASNSTPPAMYGNDAAVLIMAYVRVIGFWLTHAEQHLQQHHQLREMQARVHMLLPSLLLHYAAGLPNDARFLISCNNTAYSGKGALQVWEILKQQQQEEETQQFRPAELAAELLPTVLTVSARVKQLLAASVQGGPEAAMLAVVDPDITPQLCRTAYADVTRLLVTLVELSHSLAPAMTDVYQPALAGSLCKVLSVLECFVRSTATEFAVLEQPYDSIGNNTRCAVREIAGLFVPRHYQPLVRLAFSTAPGSRERQQLYSLLFSLNKLANNLWSREPDAHSLALACTDALVACCPALLMTQSQAAPAAPAATGGADAASPHATPTIIHTSVRPAEEWESASAGELVSVLPSLVLAGRCCLVEAQRLQQDTPPQENGLDLLMAMLNGIVPGLESGLDGLLQPCQAWLGFPTVSQQLAAAGYDPQMLQQAAAEALTAWTEATAGALALGNPSPLGSRFTILAQKLQAAGAALAAVAVPGVCNNPSCVNVDGPTELSIVSGQGKGNKCSGCRTASYCSPQCQHQAWAQHKPVCRALAAAGSRGAH